MNPRMAPPAEMTKIAPMQAHVAFAETLRGAVLAQDFTATPDHAQQGAPVGVHPSIDLAVVAFPPDEPPRWANVLFSREHPHGVVAHIGRDAGAVQNIRYLQDLQGANGESIAWAPDANWATLPWQPLRGAAAGTGVGEGEGGGGGGSRSADGHPDGDADAAAHRFPAPYPASLLKLMVAVGLGLALDRRLIQAWPAALEPMMTVSDNEATNECVALLHAAGAVTLLNQRLAELGLSTLQLNNTTPGGGWRNGDGAGVGHIHMTAWDTVRLLWLLDAAAPPTPWLPFGVRLLSDAARGELHAVLRRQKMDEVLSSGSLRQHPGWVRGLPDAPSFAHKTGTTENYAADAGIVNANGAHYLVAVLTNLGRRYAPIDAPRDVSKGAATEAQAEAGHESCATTWRLPALGGALRGLLEHWS